MVCWIDAGEGNTFTWVHAYLRIITRITLHVLSNRESFGYVLKNFKNFLGRKRRKIGLLREQDTALESLYMVMLYNGGRKGGGRTPGLAQGVYVQHLDITESRRFLSTRNHHRT
jgi:hypothetical protein